MTAAAPFQELWIRVRDGLRLHVRHYPAPGSDLRPVLCLPGLTRNVRDFHPLATVLAGAASGTPRPVYALDARGRGLSDHDPDGRNYAVPVETHDAIDVMTALGLHGAAIVGTSRGGLVAMVLAALQPTVIGAVVLNDIGPVIEREGLARIAGYVGRVPLPATWAEAATLVRTVDQHQFPAIPDEAWEAIARQRFNEVDGRPAPAYDAKLAMTLSLRDAPIPSLWPQFDALRRVPVMVVRGSQSDLLSSVTVTAMAERHPDLVALTVPGEGHAPLLRDHASIAAVQHFLSGADGIGRH